VLYIIASGAAGFDVSKGFASNGFGAHSPGGYSLLAALESVDNQASQMMAAARATKEANRCASLS
jgi:hypothetical protein